MKNRQTEKLFAKIIKIIGTSAALIIVAQSPYFWNAIIKMYFRDPKYSNQQIKRCLLRLIWHGYILVSRSRQGLVKIELTEKGRKKLFDFDFWDLKIKKPKRWDKKWRLVIFDIPKDKNKIRDIFRFKLKELGFYQLQKSVWLYPYECRGEISLLREYLRITPFVKLIITKDLEADDKLLKFFKLITAKKSRS